MAKPATQKKPRGRPPQPENVRRRSNLTMRIRDETKAALERAALEKGRSLSEEAELRLEMSFRDGKFVEQALQMAYGSQAAGLVLAVAMAMDAAGRRACFVTGQSPSAMQSWPADGWSYDQAMIAAHAVLDKFRPGPAVLSQHVQEGYQTPGQHIADEIIRTIIDGRTEWGIQRRDQLGDLVKTEHARPSEKRRT